MLRRPTVVLAALTAALSTAGASGAAARSHEPEEERAMNDSHQQASPKATRLQGTRGGSISTGRKHV